MSAQPNDGGPAFPRDQQEWGVPGMSLRDWFAGQFLAGSAVGNDPLDRESCESLEDARARYWAGVAAVAYTAADAMIAARGQA